jgi:hypothetical protein
MEFYISLLLLVVIGSFCFYIAKKRQRNPYFWFFIGFFFGILGLLFLLLIPKKSQNELVPQTQPSILKQPIVASSSIISPYKDMQWHYLDEEHKTIGPLYFSELLQAWIDGRLSIKSYVWTDKMNDWQQIEQISDLKHLLETEEIHAST